MRKFSPTLIARQFFKTHICNGVLKKANGCCKKNLCKHKAKKNKHKHYVVYSIGLKPNAGEEGSGD
jgi:hypothetical protein